MPANIEVLVRLGGCLERMLPYFGSWRALFADIGVLVGLGSYFGCTPAKRDPWQGLFACILYEKKVELEEQVERLWALNRQKYQHRPNPPLEHGSKKKERGGG